MKEIKKPNRKTRKQIAKNRYSYTYPIYKKRRNNVIYITILTIIFVINFLIMCASLTVLIEFYYFSALWVFAGSVLLQWLFIKIYKFIEEIDCIHTILLNREGLDI